MWAGRESGETPKVDGKANSPECNSILLGIINFELPEDKALVQKPELKKSLLLCINWMFWYI